MKIHIFKIDQIDASKSLNDLYVNSFSNHIELNMKLIEKPHSHNFYLCVLFTEGYGKHEIDFNSYSVNPGKVFFFKTWANTFLEVWQEAKRIYIFSFARILWNKILRPYT